MRLLVCCEEKKPNMLNSLGSVSDYLVMIFELFGEDIGEEIATSPKV